MVIRKTLKTIFFLILLVFPLGQLLRFELSQTLAGIVFHPLEGLIFAFGIIWLGQRLFLKKPFSLPIFAREMILFAGLASLSLFLNLGRWSAAELIVSFLYLLRLWNFVLFYFSLTDFFKKEKIPLLNYLVVEGLAIGSFGLLQYLFLSDVRFLYYSDWDDHYFRAIGSFLDPGFMAILLVLSFLVLLNNYFDQKKKKPLFFISALFLLFMIGLSFARLSYLALILGTGIILLAKRKIKNWLVLGGIFLVTVFLLPKPGGEGVDLWRKSSLNARQENYFQVTQIIKDSPWFGVGFNAYRFSQRDYGFLDLKNWRTSHSGSGADNSFLFVWATAGIFTFLAYLFLWARVLKESYQKASRQKIALLLFSSLLTLIFVSLFINALFYPWVLSWLTMLLARFSAQSEL